MPYPPRRPRKHANREEARKASNAALVPHQFKPGQSGNPAGFPQGRREQLELIAKVVMGFGGFVSFVSASGSRKRKNCEVLKPLIAKESM